MAPNVRSVLVFSVAVLAGGLTIALLVFDDPAATLRSHGLITPISILAAGFANATAVGGGFAFIPLFIFSYGLTATASLKLSLATQAFGMTSGALGWSKHYILLRPLLLACAAGFIGMTVGTFVWVMPNAEIKNIFGWVNVGIGVAIFFEMRFGSLTHRARIANDTALKMAGYMLACAAGGLINAWVSIGIGEIVVLYLMFVYRIRIDYAIATGVATLAITSILGLAFHTGLGGIRWDYLAFTAPGAIIGGRYGAKLGRWVEAKVIKQQRAAHASPLRWVFAGILIIDGVVMLWQVYGK